MFNALGAAVYRHRWFTLILAGTLLVLAVATLLRGGELTSGKIEGLEAERAQKLADEVTGRSADTTFVVVFKSATLDPDGDAFQDAMEKVVGPLRTDPAVASVILPGEAGPIMGPRMVNAKGHAAFGFVSMKVDFKHALQAYPALHEHLRSDQLTVAATGQLPYFYDLDTTLEKDLLRAELVSMPLALVVLLVVFGTGVAAILPVGVGGLAVACAVAVVFALSRTVDIAQYTINVCSLIGLGVAIDYSLFTVSRYREELAAGHDYPKALERAMATAGRVVAFSGAAVGTGLAGLLFFQGSYLEAMGIGGAIVVALAVLFALTFLPALLAVLGPRIHAAKIPFVRVRASAGLWHATAQWVMKRPVRVLLPTLAVLLLMGAPFFHLRLAAADVRVLTEEVEARRGYEMLRADFPDEVATRMIVAVRFPSAPAITAERVGALYDLSRRLHALPHVKKVESIVDLDAKPRTRAAYQELVLHPPSENAELLGMAEMLSVGDHVILLQALSDATPESEDARNIVQQIRANRAVADGELSVGGQTASDLDATNFILSRTPRAVAFVVGVTFIVLFVLLGSVLLPLKAVVMNFLSIAGSFGALVWIFQDGHLGVHEPRPLEPTLPVLLFCCLFGLSMDYEVLMLSRIKESYERTGDNTLAVAEGLEKTAGLITSAAAIMVAVFSAFSLAHVVMVRAMGFGMAIAVALDATLVRVLLVPATMRLFGHLNWWAPRGMLRLRRIVRPNSRR